MSIYYNSNDLFSRQSPVNFIIGERGNGKSFEFKKRIIKNNIDKGKQSIYIRRRKTDIDEVKDNFFDDIVEFFPNDEFMIKGDKGYINGNVAVHFIALSTSYKIKSKPFPLVTLLVFDEYIEPATKTPNYFKDDATKLLDLLNTVVRSRNDWKLILIGNAISYVNPLFSYYKIEIKDPNKRFHSFKYSEKYNKNMITVELTETPDFQEQYSKTVMAELIGGTDYGNYAMKGEVYEDSIDFIKSRQGNYIYICSFYSRGKEVGVWYDESGDLYIDETIEKTSSNKFSILDDDLKEGYFSVKSRLKNWRIKEIKEKYRTGNIWYSSQEIKKFFTMYCIKYI
ncbi:MAG: phage DNA encapsidation protein [Paraclostridium sp.]